MKYTFTSLLLVIVLSAGCSENTRKIATDKEIELFAYADTAQGLTHGKDIEHTDPVILFAYSYHLFHHGQKDDAVFWFYLAQLRAKYLIAVVINQGLDNCNPDFLETVFHKMGGVGKPPFVNRSRIALYGVITSNFGPVINDYIFADIDKYISISNEVIAYDKQHPLDPASIFPKKNLKSPETFPVAHDAVINGYSNLVKWASDNKEKIKEKRKENGLPTK